MNIDKRVEICIIAIFILFFSLVSLIAFLSFLILRFWWRYLGIKIILIVATVVTISYLLFRSYKRLLKRLKAERIQRLRIWRRFFMELRNEARLRGTRRRREQVKKAREIRRQHDREFEQRMTRLVERGKALDEKREQCVQEYKQTLKTKQESQKKLEEENGNATTLKNNYTLKPFLPLLEERKEKMERIMQRRKEEREKNSTGKKENTTISHKVDIPNLQSIRAAFCSFIEGVKRMDQTCRSYKGLNKMYYMLYNVDYAIINVLHAMKELLNTNGTSWESLSVGLRSSHETLDIQSLEEEIDHLMSAAHSRVLFMRDTALRSIDILIEEEQTNTLATRLVKPDAQQIRSCFKQDAIIEAFNDLHDIILPRFRKCITAKMKNDRIIATNMDRWERRFDENMTKAQKRQFLTHLKVGNGYSRTLKEEDPLKRTQSLWSYSQSDLPENQLGKWNWLESLRKSNKNNSVTYLAVGGAAVIAVASYAVYRCLR